MFTTLKTLFVNTIGTVLIIILTGASIYAMESGYEIPVLTFQFKLPKIAKTLTPTPSAVKILKLAPTSTITPTPTVAQKINPTTTPTIKPTSQINPIATATSTPGPAKNEDYQSPSFGVIAPPQNVPIYDNHTCFEVYDVHDNVTSSDNVEVQYRFQGYEEPWSKNKKKCLENLNNGHYDMTTRVRDEAGNVGTISVYFEVRYTPPTPTCPYANTPTPMPTETVIILEPTISQ